LATLALFVAGLYGLAKGASDLAESFSSTSETTTTGQLFLAGVVAIGGLLVFVPLSVLAAHPRTRSRVSDVTFSAMKVLMLGAGIILFAAGAFDLAGPSTIAVELAESLVSVIFVLTPTCLHLLKR
jgi:hypothetical protein